MLRNIIPERGDIDFQLCTHREVNFLMAFSFNSLDTIKYTKYIRLAIFEIDIFLPSSTLRQLFCLRFWECFFRVFPLVFERVMWQLNGELCGWTSIARLRELSPRPPNGFCSFQSYGSIKKMIYFALLQSCISVPSNESRNVHLLRWNLPANCKAL